MSFPVSCRPELLPAFERAVALQHSFEFAAARQGFERVAADDPACAMAQWGIAMSLYHPLWAAPTADELQQGLRASERATALGAAAGVSARERGFIAAMASFATMPAPPITRRARRATATPWASSRWAVSGRPRGGDLLCPGDPRDGLADRSRASIRSRPPGSSAPGSRGCRITRESRTTRSMRSIRPVAPPTSASMPPGGTPASPRRSGHALHMPSHIFVRLGLWPEVIASNLDAAAAEHAIAARAGSGRATIEEVHALDYLEYAYLQIGDDERARGVLQRAADVKAVNGAAIPGRLRPGRDPGAVRASTPAVEAAALVLPAKLGVDWEAFPHIVAIHAYAQAVGAARTGDLPAAEAAVTRLGELQKRLVQAPPPGPYIWSTNVECWKGDGRRVSGAGARRRRRGAGPPSRGRRTRGQGRQASGDPMQYRRRSASCSPTFCSTSAGRSAARVRGESRRWRRTGCTRSPAQRAQRICWARRAGRARSPICSTIRPAVPGSTRPRRSSPRGNCSATERDAGSGQRRGR